MKKTILALVLALCLILQVVPGFASGLVFSPTTPDADADADVGGDLFSSIDIGSVVDKLMEVDTGNTSTPSNNNTGLTTFVTGNTADEDIVPFVDLSWRKVQADPEGSKKDYTSKRVSDHGISYTVELSTVESGMVSGVIRVKDDDRDNLVSVWNELGGKMLEQFGDSTELDGIGEESLACYQFVDDKTYVRYEFMDYGTWRYILFVLLTM